MKTIAVYGTLKRYHSNYPMIEGGQFLGIDHVIGQLYTNGSYPMLVRGKNKVLIEVFKVNDKVFMRADLMELGAGYFRDKIKTKYGNAIIWKQHRDQIKDYYDRIKIFE